MACFPENDSRTFHRNCNGENNCRRRSDDDDDDDDDNYHKFKPAKCQTKDAYS